MAQNDLSGAPLATPLARDDSRERGAWAGFSAALADQLPQLRAYAAVLTGSRAESEDLMQDALVRIWRYRASFKADANLRAWIFRILRNEFRSQRRHRQRWVEDVDDGLAGTRASAAGQEWTLQWREVADALASLPSSNRQALLLVAIGCSYAEAAALCGCEVATLKARVHRARVALARLTGRAPGLARGGRFKAAAVPAALGGGHPSRET